MSSLIRSLSGVTVSTRSASCRARKIRNKSGAESVLKRIQCILPSTAESQVASISHTQKWLSDSNPQLSSDLPLSVAGKIVENFIANQIITSIECANLPRPFQCSFRKGRSCERAALKLASYITDAMGGGQYCIAVFCDLKPFHTTHYRMGDVEPTATET